LRFGADSSRFRILGFGAYSSGFGVLGQGFRVSCLG